MNRRASPTGRRRRPRGVPWGATSVAAVLTVALLCTAAPTTTHAQPYAIDRFTIDGGGASLSAAGPYHLSGTIAQYDAGVLVARPYALTGGFWGGGGPAITAVAADTLPSTAPDAPRVARILPVAPNPFARSTAVAFDLPDRRAVEVAIFDVTGAVVRTLARGSLGSGHYVYNWDGRRTDGRRVAAGLYFVRVRLGDLARSQKMVVLP